MQATRPEQPVSDVLPDVLRRDLAVVFCGTAAGAASKRRGAYYAGPGNRFWRTLLEIGLTPALLEPEAYRDLLRFGIGLTDLAKGVAGSDASLARGSFDREGFRKKVLDHAPRIVAFTGKRAAVEFLGRAVEFGIQVETIGRTRVFVLPSPSGAARAHWNVAVWRDLAELAARCNEPMTREDRTNHVRDREGVVEA